MREKDKVNNRSSEQSDEIKRTYMLAGPSIRYLQRSASFANFPTEAPALRSEKLPFVSKRVDTRHHLLKEIATSSWDVILADFSLPQLNALDVLEVLRRQKNDTPDQIAR